MTMTFDALTVAGILSAVLCGGFVLATATAKAPPRSAHRRSSSAPLAEHTRIRGRAVHARRRRTLLVRRWRPTSR